MNKETGDCKRDNFIKQQQQLKAMKPTGTNKILSADSMIEELLSKKETFQKKTESSAATIQNVPSWLNPNNSTAVHPLYTKIWELVKLPASAVAGNVHEIADTPLVSSLLMTSGLTTDMLGFVWSLANVAVPGALIQTELYSILALVAIAQSGYVFNSVAVLNQLPQPPLPNLNLSILMQMKSNYGAAMNSGFESAATHSPVGSGNMTYANAFNQPIGAGYLNQYPPIVEAKTSPTSNIVSLDVNNLQSAPSLTLPNNFGYNTTQPLQQSYGPLQSVQQNFTPPSTPVAGIIPAHNYENIAANISTVQSNLSSAIPSISLGISLPQPIVGVSIIPQQIHSTTSVSSLENISAVQSTPQSSSAKSDIGYHMDPSFPGSSKPQTGLNHFDMVFSTNTRPVIDTSFDKLKSKLSELNLSDTKISSPNVKQINNETNESCESDSFNVDESFDSLCTERAFSTTNKPFGSLSLQNNPILNSENKISKPNYDVNLFDSYNDIKPIFPVADHSSDLNRNENTSKDDVIGSDSLVMHNPIFLKEEDCKRLDDFKSSISVDFALSGKVSNLQDSNVVEDDFTDFQSADFTSFNNFVPSKLDELTNNFSEFQQASVVSSVNSKSNDNSCLSTMVDECFPDSRRKCSITTDDDLFPSLNLKLYNQSTGTKAAEVSDSLSIKSIDISILSSENNTEGNSSPISNDYNSQDIRDDSKCFSQNSENGFSSYKDDKVFLSLSSSIVFENSNPSDTGCSAQKEVTRSGSTINDASRNCPLDTFNLRPEQVGDKYSALRMLETSSSVPDSCRNEDNTDDFGDFVAAEPGQLQLPDVSAIPSDSSTDSKSTEVKCLEACLNILEKSYEILKMTSTPEVLSEILSDPRGNEHLSCLLEVYRVSERLMQHNDCKSTPLATRVQTIWDLLLGMVPDAITTYKKQLEENLGPKCGVCKCNYGPTPVRYGLNYYHPPCANLYLRYVSPLLPSVQI